MRYSLKLRNLGIAMVVDDRKSQLEVSKILKVHKMTVNRWVKRFRSTGDYGAKKPQKCGRKSKIEGKSSEEFKKFISKNSALDITSLAKKWGNIGRTTMYRSLKRHKFSYKKNLGYIESGTNKLAKNTAKK